MHIAIIMDGNGRWASRRHLPRSAGHLAGAEAVDVIVEAAARRSIRTLTLYAFSAANWQRPKAEVTALFLLFRRYLLSHTRRCLDQSIRINVIGRRDRLDPELCRIIEQSERATSHCSRMQLRIAVDYSAQFSILEACRLARDEPHLDGGRFLELLGAIDHSAPVSSDVDLLIRTGGEQRLSDFLLWECAYAELLFIDTLWPDFNADGLQQALEEFARRDRRFGRLTGTSMADARHG